MGSKRKRGSADIYSASVSPDRNGDLPSRLKKGEIFMNDKKKYKILVVDDEEVIRTMLVDYLENHYDVVCTDNAEDALQKLQKQSFDLVISDINMPGMKGYELLPKIQEKYPKVKTALITAYNIDDYIRLAKEYNICNIITKTTPFNFLELQAVVEGLLTGDIFGLKRHLLPQHTLLPPHVIRSSSDGKQVREEIVKTFQDLFGTVGELKLVLDELITNAIYHAPVKADGSEKYKEFTDIYLEEKEFIHVELGYDGEKYGVLITDNQGSLRKETILYKIDRHVHAEGILDDSGRGIHMSRIFADRLIANIHPGKKTEMVLLNYIDKNYKGYKPLYINEL
jgi:CheY-like chemotaxis protein